VAGTVFAAFGNEMMGGVVMNARTTAARMLNVSRFVTFVVPPLFALMTVPTHVASAQSFDCAAAASGVEKRICLDARLRGLDLAMARLYAEAFEVAPVELERVIERDQSTWRRGRDACISVACVTASYEKRLEQLEAAAGNSTPETSCERLEIERGKDSVTEFGYTEASCYLVAARKGQRMRVRLTTASPALAFVVLDWEARRILFDGRRGGRSSEWDGQLPTNGDYLVFVDLPHSSSPGQTRHTLKVRVTY
jgi:uncharacterized protein